MFFAFGILFSGANAASAQSLDNGSIRMGANGPVGSFTTTSSAISGRVNVGAGGVQANTSLGSFGFSLPGGSSSTVSTGGMGPQGQTPGGYSSGIGSGGSAYSSQGATGEQYHESDTTNTKFQGNSAQTSKQKDALFSRQRTNLLSTGSVDPRNYNSGSFDYGFKGGNMGTVRGLLKYGWVLPKTSTGSFDGNTVSP